MARPPSLLTLARRAFRGEATLPRGSTLLVATSGGPDSIALLDVSARLATELGLRIVAHGVDHGLREAAAAELDLAEDVAGRHGVPFARTRVVVARGGNVHARARKERFAALARAARAAGATAIATAHHADDRAETFLLRLLRGAGTTGLAVLPARAPLPATHGGRPEDGAPLELVRPLLRARRSDVRAHLARHALPSADDPSNDDVRFLRARVRGEVLPLLEAIGPGVVGHLEALADELVALRLSSGVSPLTLPRATQRALAALLAAETRSESAPMSPASGHRPPQVWLPGGLVVSRATPHDRSSTAEPSPRPRRSPMLTKDDPLTAEGTGIAKRSERERHPREPSRTHRDRTRA